MDFFKDVPEELLLDRNIIEGNFIFCLWKDPELYSVYDKNINHNLGQSNKDKKRPPTFRNKESIFYYVVGKSMYDLGYTSFDEVSVMMYFENHPNLKKIYEEYGGYQTIKEGTNAVSVENSDTYFDTLAKSNILIGLHKRGFNVIDELDKFKHMTSEQIDDYYDFLRNEVMINNVSFVEIEDLVIDEGFVKAMEQGLDIGLQYNKYCPILNYITMGVPKRDLTLLGGHSGTGKSSFAFANYTIPIVENGHKSCIISNEQNIRDFQVMLVAMTLANDFKYFGLTRKKIKEWRLNEEQKEMFNKAMKLTQEKYRDKLKFVRMFDYDGAKIKRVIRRLSKQGFEFFMYDTFKSEGSADDWARLIDDSRELFQLASTEDVAIVTTYQLAPSQINRRYLDVSCLANAKQIKEVYSEMMYFREIWDDEFAGEKYDIVPYQLKRDKNGKFTKEKEYIELDRDKKYIIVFVDKTRSDEKGQNIVYEFNGRYNIWKEIGFCNVHHDRGGW